MKRFLVVLSAMILCAAAFALDATVVSVSGRVEVQENGSWFALAKGDKVEKGAVISTGFKSEAVLEVKGTKFSLGPLTRMTVQQLVESESADTAELFIDTGKVTASVNPTDGKRMGFKVRSPIATASVRGTEFSFTADGKLSVDRGVVGFGATTSSEGAADIPVAAGQESQANAATGACSNPAQEKASAATGGASTTDSMAGAESVGAVSSIASALDSVNATSVLASGQGGIGGAAASANINVSVVLK